MLLLGFFSWILGLYLWDRSRGCCCSVQPSASCQLETLCSECCRVWGTEKHKILTAEPPGAAWLLRKNPHPALPAHQKFRLKTWASSSLKKFIPRLNSKGKMISLAISGSVSKVPGTVLVTSRIGNSKCILFIAQHQPIFYFKSEINFMEKTLLKS